MRHIVINPVLNGYVVGVGCQTVCFDSKERLLSELKRYLDNPREVEKEYLTKALNPPDQQLPAAACQGTTDGPPNSAFGGLR